MTSTRAVAAIACLCAVAWTATAAAQGDRSRDDEARGLYDAGVSAYEGGRYDEALSHFQRAYELSQRDMLLYNIGSAAERANQDELALRSYEQFLERVPDTELRPRIETRIEALRRQLSGQDEREGETPPASGGDVAPWILFGIGAAVAIAGGVLLGIGLSDRATVEDAPDGAVWADGADEAYARGPALLTSGIVLLPAGVLLGVIGVVWALAAPSGERIALRIGPGSLQLAGAF